MIEKMRLYNIINNNNNHSKVIMKEKLAEYHYVWKSISYDIVWCKKKLFKWKMNNIFLHLFYFLLSCNKTWIVFIFNFLKLLFHEETARSLALLTFDDETRHISKHLWSSNILGYKCSRVKQKWIRSGFKDS